MLGITAYILVLDYRSLSILFITLPYRLEKYKGLRQLFRIDLKFSILLVAVISLIMIIGYGYILYSSRIIDDDIYVNYSAISTLVLGATGIYVYVLGLPLTVVKGVKKGLTIGLSSSLISGIISLSIAFLVIHIPLLYIWICNAEGFDINIVNPNTSIVALSVSINILKVLADIVGYTLYSCLIHIFSD